MPHLFLVEAWNYIDGLVQERRNSIADALELHLSCTNSSIFAQVKSIQLELVYTFFNTSSEQNGYYFVNKRQAFKLKQ